jgi:S1-C subfamily serine protease
MARILRGVPIFGCLADTPGQAAGILYGDILLLVNGLRTANIEQYLAARTLRADGARVRLFRDGVELEVELRFGA